MKKGEESRQRLIECAAELFWKNGYSATGISEILKQTDLPKGSFYFYFKSKDDLATAVTEYYQQILLEQFQNSSQGNDWESFIEEIFDFLSERTNGQTFAGCPYAVMGMETALGKPAVASVFMEGLKKFEQIFQEVFLYSGLSPDHAKNLSQRMLSIYQGYSRDGIARKLNQEGIMTPSEYKRKVQGLNYTNALEKSGGKGWAYPTINVILRNRVYTGAMVQHKSEKISYKVEKYYYIPEEQQYIVEGMHEAIISKDTFEQVQEIMKKRTRTPGFHSEVRKVNPYAGILVCGDCGYNLQRVTCRDGYECGTYHKKGNTICYSHFIKKEILDFIVINEIQRQAELALNRLKRSGRRSCMEGI